MLTPVDTHCGHLRSFPPYVGGDDDDIDGWQAECCGCGWKGRETESVTVAHMELIVHLNETHKALRAQVAALEEAGDGLLEMDGLTAEEGDARRARWREVRGE